MNKIDDKVSIIHELEHDMPGILSPFLNNGMRNTAFGWHVEDSYLMSMNILHIGQPKVWYFIPHSEGSKLEALSKEATTAFQCSFLLKHKLLLIPASVLKQNDIKFGKVSAF